MTTNTGGPAFPTTIHNYGDGSYCSTGISLRDYFAIKAFQGFISMGGHYDAEFDADRAYCFADAMLRAREAALKAREA